MTRLILLGILVSVGVCKAGVVEYPQMVEIKETDSAANIIEKSASVRPYSAKIHPQLTLCPYAS